MTRAPGFAAVILTLLACQAAHLAAQADSVPPAPAPAAAESVLVAAVTPRLIRQTSQISMARLKASEAFVVGWNS